MNPGYVYILTNDAMPGIVKIGRTAREVELRASELWQTGVPQPFEVFASERTCDCVQLEAYMHGELREHRVHKSREFFRVEPEVALEKLRFWVDLQAGAFIRDNFDSFAIVRYDKWVDEEAIDRLADETGATTFDVTDAMAMLTQEELLAPLRRAIAARKVATRARLEAAGWPEDLIEWQLTEGWV